MEKVRIVSVKTKDIVPFHFLLLAVGEVLLIDDYVNPQKLQDFIQNDDTFGVRPPLSDCRLALQLMENSGFIKQLGGEMYEWSGHSSDKWRDD